MRAIRPRLVCQSLYVVVMGVSLWGAFLLRFDFSIPNAISPLCWRALLLSIPIKALVFWRLRLARTNGGFADIGDVRRLILGNLVASAIAGIAVQIVLGSEFPRSVYLIDFLLCLFATALIRFEPTLWRERRRRHSPSKGEAVLIYGAGISGAALLRELRKHPELYQPVGFLDDNPRLARAWILGTPVLGSGRDAPAIVAANARRGVNISTIIIAVFSAGGRQFAEMMANCRAARVQVKVIPGMAELISGDVITKVRNVSVSDMLARNPVHFDEAQIRASVEGKSVMVTGAAGSIGSELSRQLARFRPSSLALFDQAESELFKIENELRERHPGLKIVCQLGDIRDPSRIAEALDQSRAISIYHAAAYKHVPMLEAHVIEAVINNILGTWNLVCATRRRAIQSFVMISTDKAVNPTSLMGATKRVCELIVAEAGHECLGKTRFTSVRFGNVLGSNGSVVQTFQAQIAGGGPVTVTHPDMCRYFMTIPEAVMLTLQASTMSRGREIFMLDMGELVKIVDLACNMIRLAGLAPHEDIEIQFTGLRPGEKLFEEINFDAEHSLPTFHEKIRIFHDPASDRSQIGGHIANLQEAVLARSETEVVRWLRRFVPEYQSPNRQIQGEQPIKLASPAATLAAAS
jgi:FlaA1/EpsC-like NDP-sugar epimerase